MPRNTASQTEDKITETPEFKAALHAWEEILGKDNVFGSINIRQKYARTTLPFSNLPSAILKPHSTIEVQRIVRIANQFKIPIYPVSCGKNWGYGSFSPPSPGQVVVELSGLNKIIEVNEDLGYAVIEPGVTQGQLYSYLTQNNIDLWPDVTGAGPDASILGNTLERGYGHTTLGDRFHNSCGYEVILADGTRFQTGFGHYKSSKVTYLFKTGLGPSLDGLFTQSNLGIVTKIGVWLMPKPEKFMAFAFKIQDKESLIAAILALRRLRMQGILQSEVHIANDLRVLSSSQIYPWHLTGGKTPLPDHVRKTIRMKKGLGEWNALGALYGDKYTVSASKKSLKKALKGIARPIFVDDFKLSIALTLAKVFLKIGFAQGLRQKLQTLIPAYNLLKGQPDREHLKGVYWRLKDTDLVAQRPNPHESDVGLMWLSPVVPVTKNAVLDYLSLIEPIYLKHGFEPLSTFIMANPRAFCSILSINYDRNDPEEKARAGRCYKELFNAIMEGGYIPYRAGIQSFKWLGHGSSGFWDVIKKLKKTLDPSGILAPGRYDPLA